MAFDLMSYQDNDAKVRRGHQLAEFGAQLISCHTGWNEQAAGRTLDARLVATGSLKPADVPRLRPYADTGSLHSVVSGSAVTRAEDPAAVVDAFLTELAHL